MKNIQIKEIKKYQTEDGSIFDTEEEATEYAQLTNCGLYKSLVERVQKLEREILALQTKIATLDWTSSVRINRPPYQQPMYSEPLPNYTVMNTPTENKEQ